MLYTGFPKMWAPFGGEGHVCYVSRRTWKDRGPSLRPISPEAKKNSSHLVSGTNCNVSAENLRPFAVLELLIFPGGAGVLASWKPSTINLKL